MTIELRLLFTFPAALDDGYEAYLQLLKQYQPQDIFILGTSSRAALVLSVLSQLKTTKQPMLSAVILNSPWLDLSKTRDSYYSNEGVDNILVSYDEIPRHAASTYANSYDYKDPLLSPIHTNIKGFPPALLFTGARDLFLSNTILNACKITSCRLCC